MSLENCDGRNEDEGRGEEDGEQQQQQQQQQQQSFGFQSLQQATIRNTNVQRTKTKHGGKNYRKRHGIGARAMLATAASQVEAPPGSMVPVTIAVQKTKEAPKYSNEDLIGACELYRTSAKEKDKPGKLKAVTSAYENIPTRTIRKWAKTDPKTGLPRFEELRRTGAPTPEERMNGGKKSVLTQDFVFMLFTMITYSAFTEQPMKKKDICAVILAHLKSTAATFASGKRKRGEKNKLVETPYVSDHDMNNLFRMFMDKCYNLDCNLKVRSIYQISMGRVLAQKGVVLEDWEAFVRHRIEVLAERQWIDSKGEIVFSFNNLLNFDEFQLTLYKSSSGDYVVVPNNCRVQRVIPGERMSHTTVIVATLGGRVIACTIIVAKPSLQGKEDVIHSVKELTERGQFCRYSASSNGWCEKKIKLQFCQDVVNRINRDPELRKLYILVMCDAHFSNLQMDVVNMFRAERFGFMFTPSKLTAYLQAADAPFGIITTMQKLAQTLADKDYYRQRFMSSLVKDIALPEIMEEVIKTLQSDPEKYGALIKKSWKEVGMFEVSKEDAVTKWKTMDRNERPFAPSRVNYDLFGVNRINRAFRKHLLVHEKPLHNVPEEIKTACADLFQLHRDNVNGNGLSSARTLRDMTANGADMSLDGNADDANLRRREHNENVANRAADRARVKKELRVLKSKASELTKAKAQLSKKLNSLTTDEEAIENVHTALLDMELSRELFVGRELPTPPLPSASIAQNNATSSPPPSATLSVREVAALVETNPTSREKLCALVMEQAPKILKTGADSKAFARLLNLPVVAELKKNWKKNDLQGTIFSQTPKDFSLFTALAKFNEEVNKLEKELKDTTTASDAATEAVKVFEKDNEAILSVSHEDERQKLLTDKEANDKNMAAAREETAQRLKNIFDNSEKIDEALNDIADNDPLVQNDILAQDERQFYMFANAIRNSEYFRTLQMKAVDSRSERAAKQRTPLEDIQNNDEILPLEINDDMDDFLNDNNDDFLNENEDFGGSY